MLTLTELPATTATAWPANRALELTATTELIFPAHKRLLDFKPAAPADIPQVSLDDAIRQRFTQMREKAGVNGGPRGLGDDRSMREGRATEPGAQYGSVSSVRVGLTETDPQPLGQTARPLSSSGWEGAAISRDEADRRDRQFVEMYTCSGDSGRPCAEMMIP